MSQQKIGPITNGRGFVYTINSGVSYLRSYNPTNVARVSATNSYRPFWFCDPISLWAGRLAFKVSHDFRSTTITGSGSLRVQAISWGYTPNNTNQEIHDDIGLGTIWATWDSSAGALLLDLGADALIQLQVALDGDRQYFPFGIVYASGSATRQENITVGAIASGPWVVVELDALVTTTAASAIMRTTATLGGNATTDGGATGGITERGVCYNTTGTPTVLDTIIQSGTGEGSYSVGATGLTENTTYYVRAYVITAWGVFYGTEVSFKTYAGRVGGDNVFPGGPTFGSKSGGGLHLTMHRAQGDNQFVPNITIDHDERLTGDNQFVNQPLV